MSDAGAFAVAVSAHWVALMSGVVAISAGVVQYARNKQFAPIIWVVIGLACLFFASYQAWRDQKIEAAEVQCKILKFERRSEAKNGLASLAEQANSLLSAKLTKGGDPEEYKNWTTDVEKWYANVRTWVATNLGNAAVTKATDTADIPMLFWSQGISQEHNNALSQIARVKKNLEELMESSAWDDFDIRVASSIVACSER
jgi:hypothetical protein